MPLRMQPACVLCARRMKRVCGGDTAAATSVGGGTVCGVWRGPCWVFRLLCLPACAACCSSVVLAAGCLTEASLLQLLRAPEELRAPTRAGGVLQSVPPGHRGTLLWCCLV
jgi:hypothetical protein